MSVISREATRSSPKDDMLRMLRDAYPVFSSVFAGVSGEWILSALRQPNGGGVVVVRSLLLAVIIYILGIGIRLACDRTSTWSLEGLRDQIHETLPWFGAILAAAYAALYARFASQWTYLANLYNQIKAAECADQCNKEALLDWKAAFVEDAEDLHLAQKPVFASVIRIWMKDDGIQERYKENVPGGEPRLKDLMKRVEEVWEKSESKWSSSGS